MSLVGMGMLGHSGNDTKEDDLNNIDDFCGSFVYVTQYNKRYILSTFDQI